MAYALFNKTAVELWEEHETEQEEIQNALMDFPLGENDHELEIWYSEEDNTNQEKEEIKKFLGVYYE